MTELETKLLAALIYIRAIIEDETASFIEIHSAADEAISLAKAKTKQAKGARPCATAS